MSLWLVIQVLVNVCMLAGLGVCFAKLHRSKEDDPRLTQGLRLLQSKISVLEDLSDHTENQVKQLMTLLDKKLLEVRGTLQQVNQHIGEVDKSIAKSQRMAQIIQQEIPHDQIVEKKIENKYIQASQMAHQGATADQIVQALGLPKAEVELITKVNRNACVYDRPAENRKNVADNIFEKSLQMPEISSASMEKAQLNFQQAVQEHNEKSGFESIELG